MSNAEAEAFGIRHSEFVIRNFFGNPIAQEEPRVIPRILDIYMRGNGYGMEELATILRSPKEEIVLWYIPAKGLRLAQ